MIAEILASVLAAVIAITLHEAAHGYAADALGDPTARLLGRISLNPLRHVDPVGTLLVPGILLVSQLLTIGRVEAMFGWARPVPVDIRRLYNPRWGMMWVALAGPAMNVLLAFIAALAAHLAGLLDGDWVALLYRSVALFMLVNLVLASFNMLPIPPLDGGRVVTALLPYALARPYAGLERYGLFIVLGLLFVLPRISPELDVMGWALRHVVAPVFSLLLRAAGHPV
ncbi:site-2 protease family protein [Rhodovarius sp.]|uniref:site-2 protease family protein n=1 Tax=Rhodovarius sp. TaxID=2972673 RepID=UPI00333F7698